MKTQPTKAYKPREPKRDPRQWRETNPDYRPSKPEVSASGRIVVIDGGSLFDYADSRGLRGGKA